MSKATEKAEAKAAELADQFDNFKALPIEVLRQAPWNYKNTDDVLQSKLAANIKRSGQVENILVRPLGDGTYEVTNGNHRLMALQSLGYKKVFCYDLGPISEAAAKRIAIETNETKFESDPFQLAKIVNEIAMEFEDFSTTAPFSEEQLGNFGNMLNFDWDAKEETDGKEATEAEDVLKGKKTETVLSVGGEDFKVLKLELSAPCAERFIVQLDRLKSVGNGSADDPINKICEVLERLGDDELHLDERPEPKKSAKKASRLK